MFAIVLLTDLPSLIDFVGHDGPAVFVTLFNLLAYLAAVPAEVL